MKLGCYFNVKQFTINIKDILNITFLYQLIGYSYVDVLYETFYSVR